MLSSPGFVLSSAAVASACLLPIRKPAGSYPGRRRLSCKATSDDDVRVDRRDVLLGLTGVGAAATTSSLGLALAQDATAGGQCVAVPITAEVLQCVSDDGFECQVKYDPKDVIDFTMPLPEGPKRVRKAAHLLTHLEVKNFEKAFQEMRNLKDDDPRSFKRQAAIHKAYCDMRYKVVPKDGGPVTLFDVHFSSIFAPWHRMYIYFFEGILGHLIDEPTFGLPYWNWDAPEGMMMPAIFANESSPLYDDLRDKTNVHKVMNFDRTEKSGLLPCTDDACVIENNLCSLYRQMAVGTPEDFYGGKFCNTEKNNLKVASAVAGSLENGAHSAAHIWLGQGPGGPNMGSLSTAALDPVFYSNHSNVDRMWHIHSTKLGGPPLREELLDTSFVFYDAQKRPVRISVRDVRDVSKLGYNYKENGRLEWMHKRSKGADIQRPTGKKVAKLVSEYPMPLKEEPLYLTVDRPEKAQAGGGSNKKASEELVVDVTIDPCEYVKFYVLVNVPKGQEKKVGPQNCEFGGSFTHVPHGKSDDAADGGMKMQSQTVSYQIPLRELVEDLKCGEDHQLDITLVPCHGEKIIIIGARVI